MIRRTEPGNRPRRTAPRAYLALAALLIAVVALGLGSAGVSPVTLVTSSASHGAPNAPAGHAWGPARSVAVAKAIHAAAPSIHPAASAFNPPCYPVYSGKDNNVCVSIKTPSEPQIIPIGNNRSSPVMPSPNVSLPLIVKSEFPLTFATQGGTPTNGPHSPIALNVTGTLWNGDPYYSVYDSSTWHASGNTWWLQLPDSNNKSFPKQYEVNFTAKGQNGGANFFAGMDITWWIYLVFSTNNVSYRNHEGPHLSFTYSGAWPYSPYASSPHYGGPGATFLDVNVTTAPRSPNWNDSVAVTVNTTPSDIAPYNATIGSCLLDFVEISNSVVVVNTSIPFNVSVASNGFGNYTTNVKIPSEYAQVEGAQAAYRIWISDTAKPADQVVTPWYNYTVGGNGSFSTGIFASDIIVTMNPASVLLNQGGTPANLTPGQTLTVLLNSRSATTALLAAQIQYTVSYPLLKESLSESFFLHRISSVEWIGSLPGLPVQTIVNFTIWTWDFSNAVEVSSVYTYNVDSFDQYVPPLGPDQAFFYVYVYDNGSHQWVQGAGVQIQSVNGLFNSISNTTLGVAYSNQTGTPYDPLVLQANVTYNVTVDDHRFVPGGGSNGAFGPVSVQVLALPIMTDRRPLASTDNYVVLQQGDQILFYLNATATGPVASPSVEKGNPLGTLQVAAILGLIGATLAVIPVRAWWRQIKARRTAEEKRVTL